MKQQALLISLLLFVSALANGQVTLEEKFEKSWSTEDTTEKRVLREEIASEFPDSEYGLLCKAWLLTLKGDNTSALDLYSKAVSLKSGFWQAYFNRGVLYGELADYSKAVADYSKTIELNPAFADAYINRGNNYQDLQDFPKAISDYNKAVSITPNDLEIYYNRGNAFLNSSKFADAVSDYTKAISMNPDFGIAYYNRGGAFYSIGDKTRACEDWNKAYTLGILLAKHALDRFCK
ncbi:MAG: tetratricopeptide repeat protein [Ignavibacteriota bacterium]|nr:tetratricopeptide repeat protein [Ignavibacteriota bacterium]